MKVINSICHFRRTNVLMEIWALLNHALDVYYMDHYACIVHNNKHYVVTYDIILDACAHEV